MSYNYYFQNKISRYNYPASHSPRTDPRLPFNPYSVQKHPDYFTIYVFVFDMKILNEKQRSETYPQLNLEYFVN